jgi:hypothetical protein
MLTLSSTSLIASVSELMINCFMPLLIKLQATADRNKENAQVVADTKI